MLVTVYIKEAITKKPIIKHDDILGTYTSRVVKFDEPIKLDCDYNEETGELTLLKKGDKNGNITY